VVTLAGLLTWFGAQLHVLGETGTINLYDPNIDLLTGKFFGPTVGWTLAGVVVVILGVDVLIRRRRRTMAGLPSGGVIGDVARFVVIAAAILGAMAVLAADRGLPLAVLILLAFVVFAICGTMAAAGGIMGASRLLAVNYSSGTGDTLLNAIAAAVIGGTSLFGGRGTVWSAITGSLVIGSITNGLALLSAASDVKFMVTGGVLLAAVTIDAVARQGRQKAGVA
jgi:D-xylose transport system permease protein